MSLIRYTPYSMGHLQQQLNRMFDQFDTDLFGRSEELGGGMFTPAVDVKEDAEAYTVHMEVPGVPQENLNITLQDNVLTIRGAKEQKQEHTEGQFRRVERSYGTFARSLSLPRNVDGGGVTANLTDGVLEVRLPKLEDAKPRQITVGGTAQSASGTTYESSNAQIESSRASALAGAEETTKVDVTGSAKGAGKGRNAPASGSSSKATGSKRAKE